MTNKQPTMLLMLTACDPKLMPTFPQHRNIKSSKQAANPESNVNTGAGDQTNNLPAISDLVCYIMTNISNSYLNFFLAWIIG